ncbi:16S rRNA (guanine(527)-N(7))-methyltransferase RsmG [Nitratifractor salsuginis]|uniref:Ribosomal RNA small subunit methyltransferase G n=1 Tax=Nitratifractor salsuginis (strain DSM 16511 / JCM 12458 / E9I37-1) TaxID=749222 RepID=E6X2F7_NITSE|nr:16S rRNA (guanine(527)-N(7))-methyltransferase RsmG [Nitratifractor salsuginis]ADV47162.1 methyltransferase GidB [Nitratifractor salsuginis DSM 16511]
MGSESLRVGLVKVGLELDERVLERLEHFTELLLEWNRVHNLTGARDRREIEANILDSLVPLSFVSKPDSLLDVGTGAGFPGLVLAAAWPEIPTVLCEPLKKRASFLRIAALEMGLERVEVARKRVEDLQHEPFGLISSRAVTDTGLLLELTRHLSDERTRYLFYKGTRVEEEIAELPETLKAEIIERPPRRYLYLQPAA